MRIVLIFGLLCAAASSVPAKVNLAAVASATTVAVNAGTMAKWLRHPVREAKKTASQVKKAVKGKN